MDDLYACERCGAVYAHPGGCSSCGHNRMRELTVVEEEEHVCETCGEEFGSAPALNSHQRVHTDDEE